MKGCCESCKKPNAVGWRGRPCAMGNVGHARPNYCNTHVRWKHLSRFPCRDVREAFDLSQRVRRAEAHRFQSGASRQWRKAMKQMSLTTVAIAASTFACTALLSFSWSEQRGLSLSVEKAEARVGRPLTPVSVAGVARRQHRRAAYGAGGMVVGRYGGGANNRGGLVGGD